MLDMVCPICSSLIYADCFICILYNSFGFGYLKARLLNLVRPELNDTIAIRKGRYPMMQGQEFVANDAFASQTCRFQIITGPNMSGKSTYLRQIALLCIMAQIGSLYSPRGLLI